MIAIDTNILVRFLVDDHPQHAERARHLLLEELSKQAPGFVSVAMIVELAWVLTKVYKLGSEALRAIVWQLIASPHLIIENSAVIKRALRLELPDLAAAIIHEAGKQAGCEATATFDRRFARVPGVMLLS